MQLQADGDLQIAPGETVTVGVTAVNTHYLAIFGDLLRADWVITQPLQAVQGGAGEVRSFTAGAGGTESFAITCDFVRNAQGQTNPNARYEIAIRGSNGPFTIQKRILAIPPFPANRPFMFEVVGI